ncbi:hypothetical protein DFS34DRAFT_59473 [Phlyctochytrium arcticum]|nr:hypothetical protein DFS34DRAFT_59473 [Phlyctochytrium arcticum]
MNSEWAAPGDVKRSILETVCSVGTVVQRHQPDMTRFKLVTEICLQAICDKFQKVCNTSAMNARNIPRSGSIHSLLSVTSQSSDSTIQSKASTKAQLHSRKTSLMPQVSNVFGNQPQQEVEPVYPSRSTPEPMHVFPPSRIPCNPMHTYGADRTSPTKTRGSQGLQTQSMRGSPTKSQPTRGQSSQSSGTSAKFTKDIALDALIKAIEWTGLNGDLAFLTDKFAKQSFNRISTLNQTHSPAVLSVALKRTLLNWCDKADSEKEFLSSREARQNINTIFKHTDQEPEKLAESLRLSLEETLDSEQKKRMALLFHHWNRVWQAIQTEGVDNNLGFNLACLACFVKIRYESKRLTQTHISLANFLCKHAHKVFPITSATKRKVSQGGRF